MLPAQRIEAILKYLDEDKAIKIDEIAKVLDVTPMTIRRDLQKLEEKGVLYRTHGGAVLKDALRDEQLYKQKREENAEVKERIAKEAYKLLKDGMTIVLDSGSSTFEISKLIKENTFLNLTVVTNDINIAFNLYEASHVNLIVIGGMVQRETGSCMGNATIKALNDFYFDMAFIGTSSISDDLCLCTPSEWKVAIKKLMVKNANQSVLLADKSKFNQRSMYKINYLTDYDYVITDYDFDDGDLKTIEMNKTNLVKV